MAMLKKTSLNTQHLVAGCLRLEFMELAQDALTDVTDDWHLLPYNPET
jgi:hypothetical protein